MKNKKIPWAYRRAFSTIAKKLIFFEGTDTIPFSIAKISEKIQEQYIMAYDRYHKKFEDEICKEMNLQLIDTGTNEVIGTFTIPAEKKKPSLFEETCLVKSKKELLELIQSRICVLEGISYHWGFTPFLGTSNFNFSLTYFGLGLNCFGKASLIGSLAKTCGISIDFGITPDHPYAVAYLPDGIYFVDTSMVRKMNGVFEDHGTYKIYRPTTEDKEQKIPLTIIHSFNDALVYEILENIEVLRRVSSGDIGVMLPRSKIEGEKLAHSYADILHMTNWKNLQAKLFPEITDCFISHREIWDYAVTKVAEMRLTQYAEQVFDVAACKAQKATSYCDLEFEVAHQKIFDLSQEYCAEIMFFLEYGTAFIPGYAPRDIVNYYTVLKESIEEEEKEHQISIGKKIYSKIEKCLISLQMKENIHQTKFHHLKLKTMFGIRKWLKGFVTKTVDDHLEKNDKAVIVEKTVVEHHHHYPDGSKQPRQDGSDLRGSTRARKVLD